MNYCENIHYTIHSTYKSAFSEMAERLIKKLPKDHIIIRLVFFDSPADDKEYLHNYTILRQQLSDLYKEKTPIVSYITQPPLDGNLAVEVHSYTPNKNDSVQYKSYNDAPYISIKNENGFYLYLGGIQGSIDTSIKEQSEDVFNTISGILQEEQLSPEDIVRQWNYIANITAHDGDNQNYQSFNNARSDFYGTSSWKNGYPAATGIGTNCGGILIDLDAVSFSTTKNIIVPIDNKLQVSAHKYSEQVLERSCERKSTPKFERAKALIIDDKKLIYISGTAAIRGEESLRNVGLKEQLDITMENIFQLTGNSKIVMLRVYLKDFENQSDIEQMMSTYNLNIPIVYIQADVCRDELLVEIEGIAIQL